MSANNKKAVYVEGTNLFNLNDHTYSNNTSGRRGVNWHKTSNSWRAQINFKGKRYSEYFRKKEDAIMQREVWEKLLYESIIKKYENKKGENLDE